MTTTIAALFGLLALAVAWFRRKARRAEAERDQEHGARVTAEARREVTVRVDADQAAARDVARERASDPVVVNAPTPTAQVDAALDGLRKERERRNAAAAKVRDGRAKGNWRW